MGYIRVKALVANPLDRSKREEIEVLVDTGAIFTMLPSSLLQSLGITSQGVRKFKVANGNQESFPIGEAYIKLPENELGATSIVIFGPENSTPLLGVTTLENLGLQVDPTAGKLKPMELLLL